MVEQHILPMVLDGEGLLLITCRGATRPTQINALSCSRYASAPWIRALIAAVMLGYKHRRRYDTAMLAGQQTASIRCLL